MISVQQYEGIKNRYEQAKLKQARLEGELNSLKETAKTNYKVNSLKELTEKINKSKETIDALEMEINKDIDEIVAIMDKHK